MKESEKRINAKLVLSILAAGIMSFSGVVVETAMNVTFPTLMKEFGIGTSTVQWITTGYLLVLAIIIPASSYLKKRFKMKALFVTAVCLFILGTVMAAAAPVFPVLLGGRLIQGVGTGITANDVQHRSGAGSGEPAGTYDGHRDPDHGDSSRGRTVPGRSDRQLFRVEDDLCCAAASPDPVIPVRGNFHETGDRDGQGFFSDH